MFNIVYVHLLTCEIVQCTSMSKLGTFIYIYMAAILFLPYSTVWKLHPPYVARKASMIRYITLEFVIISKIILTIIIFWLFGCGHLGFHQF